MIDVNLNTHIGRQLLGMTMGLLTQQEMVKKKNLETIQNELQKINDLQKESEVWEDISIDMSTRFIDKRFNASKGFVETGGIGSPVFKKSTTEEEKRLLYVVNQNVLKTRLKYDSSVSAHNKRLADSKKKASFRLADLKKII